MQRRNELYARYLEGHARGKARAPRPALGAGASIRDWALELGYLDGLGERSVRRQDELALWCLCSVAYQRGVASSACEPCGLEADASDAASVSEFGAQLSSRDALSGRVRTPVELAELLRALGQ